jgi:chromosome partitioning protein
MVISFANQKGGVGKTTSAINVASALGTCGKKVLLCDMDPQSNATSGVGIKKQEVSASVYDVIIGQISAQNAIVKTKFENLWLLPSNINLAGAEIELVEEEAETRVSRLKTALEKIVGDYDYIIVDCPPSLGILTLNALNASDYVIVTMQCEYFALEGLSQLTHTLAQVKKIYNPKIELGGILITMFDGRLNLTIQVLDDLKKYFPDKIFKSPVPRTVRLSEAPSHGMPINYYDKFSKASASYLSIAQEIIEVVK